MIAFALNRSRLNDAKRLVGDIETTPGARLLGVEAFRMLDNRGIQPGIEFSNISFGQLEQDGDRIELKTYSRGLRAAWRAEQDFCDRVQKLIDGGIANGFDWYEVSVEDLATNELLFFRAYGGEIG